MQFSDTDRLYFALIVSTVLYTTLIFGIRFEGSQHSASSHTLEIILAQHRSDDAPDDADFIAQANQHGSGDLDEAAIMSTTETADFNDNVIREIQPQPTYASSQNTPSPDAERITTTRQSSFSTNVRPKEDRQQKPAPQNDHVTLLQRSLEIASLEAELREKRQTQTKRPRKRQLTSASTREARDALYLDDWRLKIEAVGNQYYPDEARKRKLYGSLRLLVAINYDGTIHELSILKSSGYKILDDAAINIVRRAAPFAPFPENIREDTDILEVIRTWQFEPGGRLSGR